MTVGKGCVGDCVRKSKAGRNVLRVNVACNRPTQLVRAARLRHANGSPAAPEVKLPVADCSKVEGGWPIQAFFWLEWGCRTADGLWLALVVALGVTHMTIMETFPQLLPMQ